MKHSLKDGSGYLIIDHKDSPVIKEEEVPIELRKNTVIVNSGKVYEADIQSCSHCQRGVILNPDRVRARGYCPKCHHYICDTCRELYDKTLECVPFKQVFDKLVQ